MSDPLDLQISSLHYDGLSCQQIADKLEISLSYVKMHLPKKGGYGKHVTNRSYNERLEIQRNEQGDNFEGVR